MRPTPPHRPHAVLAVLAAFGAALPAAACAAPPLRPAAAAPVAADTLTDREQRDRERERRRREQQAERERRQVERERAQADRERAQAGRERAARDSVGDVDLDGLPESMGRIGAVIGTAVREGLRGAAEGIRAVGEALASDDYDDDARPAQPVRLDTTVTVGRDPVVDLSLVSGDVTVTAGTGSTVRVRGYSERLPLRFEHSGSSVRVWTPRVRARSAGEQRLEVVVPAGARVVAASVSGDVSVRGVGGELEATSVSGDVDVADARRRVVLSSVSGSVRGARLAGDVRAHGVSGDVALDDVTGADLDVETVSGEVDLRRVRATRVRTQSVSGDVAWNGTLARDGRYDFESHSGEIRLALPTDAAASLVVRTFSGSIDSNLPLTMRPDDPADRDRPAARRDRRMEFTLGGGGARVTAETFSGRVTLSTPAPR